MNDDWVDEVTAFWFDELEPKQWFSKSDAVDAAIRDRFAETYQFVRNMNVATLAETPEKAVAGIIVLDQFPRNMFRDNARAFDTDEQAREVAEIAIEAGHDDEMTDDQRHFLYMPYMHSESLDEQDRAVELFEKLGKQDGIKFAKAHRDVIAEFGRFPHRNEALGRETTREEQEWLDKGGGF